MSMDLKICPGDRILVVAPHPDDESIGCGGLLALYGKQCDVLLLTDGRRGHMGRYDGREEELVKLREEELRRAVELAGVHKLTMLRIPDSELFGHDAEVGRYDIREYDYIFVTNHMESHEDHRMCFRMLKKMKRSQHAKAMLMEYEVWTPMVRPSHYLDITDVIGQKRDMIEQHQSQMMDIDYAGKGIALSCYRGINIKAPYAEAYTAVGRKSLKKAVSARIPKVWKRKIKKAFTGRSPGETENRV